MKYNFDVQVHVASSNFLLDVIVLEGQGIRVRERRIPKAIKPKDEGSPDKGSQRKEASVIL
jgi:hypothetical protein